MSSYGKALVALIGSLVFLNSSNIAEAVPLASTIDGRTFCSERYVRLQAGRQLITPFPDFFLNGDTARIQSWFAARGYMQLQLYSPLRDPGRTVYGFNTLVAPYSRVEFRILTNQVRELMQTYTAAELTQMFEQAALGVMCELFGGAQGDSVLRMADTLTMLAALAVAKKAQESGAAPPPAETPGTLAGFELTEFCEENPGLCCFLPEGPDSWWEELIDNADFSFRADGTTDRFGITSGISLGGGWSLNVGAGFENEINSDDGPVDGGYGEIGLTFGS